MTVKPIEINDTYGIGLLELENAQRMKGTKTMNFGGIRSDIDKREKISK